MPGPLADDRQSLPWPITVFGVIAGGKVVWKTPYEITATTCVPKKAADGHPACRVRTLRG
jgi:hypothetical protein